MKHRALGRPKFFVGTAQRGKRNPGLSESEEVEIGRFLVPKEGTRKGSRAEGCSGRRPALVRQEAEDRQV